MNILFVHEVDILHKVVFDIHFLSEALSVLGHNVFVIDYEDRWRRGSPFDLGSLRTKHVDGISRAFPEASVCLRRPGFIKIPGLSRMSAAFTHYLEIKKTIKEKEIDAIVLYSVPTNGLQAVYLANKFNIPISFRSIDKLSILVPHYFLRPLTKLFEKRVYSQVDVVLPNTPQYSNYIANMGVEGSKIRLLHFPVDTRLFHPSVESPEVRQKWGFNKKDQIIVFVGTLFSFSGLDVFIRQFPKVLKQVPVARLLIVGDGPQRLELEHIIDEMNLKGKVIITGFQPYETMPQYINLATICINTFPISQTIIDIFPAKILQYIACGKATVATPLLGITPLLPGESHGIVYADCIEDLAKEVITLLKSTGRRQKLESAGIEYVRQTHDYEKIVHELENILGEIIQGKQL